MCGIAGCISQRNTADALASVQRMLPAIAHRGPDGEGLDTWEGVAFGHRRLAIIDLSEAGRQPMVSSDRKVGVVFNGCIYNFLEIRKELEGLGHAFHSNCDTEVLVNGYLAWGIRALVPRLRGMFAFAIWDDRSKELFLVRDRLGVKPLVYARTDHGIAFASTVDALRAAGLGGELDPQALLEVLEFGFVTDERCAFSGIEKLAPGHILEWRSGKSKVSRYWELSYQQDSSISFEDAVEETERLLVEAVRLRLIADVPVGALLSSGIDSGLICWALTHLNANIRSFTVGTPGDPEDETEGARQTAQKLGIPNEVVTIPIEGGAPLEELLHAYSEPFASSSALGVLKVSRAVKPHATVLLTGDGADDVYLGYPFMFNAWRAERLANRLPPGSRFAWKAAKPLLSLAPATSRARNFLSYVLGGIGAYARVRRGLPYFEERDLLGSRMRGLSLPHREVPDSVSSGKQLLDDVLRFHQRFHFLSEFMTKVDGATMWHALEARSPFLDHTIWEFAARIPYSIRFQGGQLKAILREIARRRLGRETSERPKSGFSIPAERWLLERWKANLQALAVNSVAAEEGWFNRAALQATVKDAISKGETSPQLWHALVLESWLRDRKSA